MPEKQMPEKIDITFLTNELYRWLMENRLYLSREEFGHIARMLNKMENVEIRRRNDIMREVSRWVHLVENRRGVFQELHR